MSKKNIYIISFFCVIFLSFVSRADTKTIIDIQQKDKDILAKQKFEVLVSIKAEKQDNPYCFFPPEFGEQNDKISLEVKKLATQESEKDVNLQILVEGIAQEPGEYNISPMRVPYILLSRDMESEFIKDNTRVIPTSYWDIPSLQIKVKDEKGMKYTRYTIIGGGIVLLSVIFIFSILFSRRKNKRQTTKAEMTFNEYFHKARKFRLDGDYYEYLKTLLEMIQKIQERGKDTELLNLEQKLKEKINEVGYKGTSPTEQEMDLFWKEVTHYVSVYENKGK